MQRYYTHYKTRIFILSPKVLAGLSALASAPMNSARRLDSDKEIRQVSDGRTRNLAAALALGALVLSCASGRVGASQSVQPTDNASDAIAQSKLYSGKFASLPGETAMKKTAQSVDATQTAPPTVSPAPKQAELKRATPFNGDLRDLPQTKPVQKERPARKPPKLRPRTVPPRS